MDTKKYIADEMAAYDEKVAMNAARNAELDILSKMEGADKNALNLLRPPQMRDRNAVLRVVTASAQSLASAMSDADIEKEQDRLFEAAEKKAKSNNGRNNAR